MLPSISESGAHLLSLEESEAQISGGNKPPIIPRITATSKQVGFTTEMTLTGYSFLDTLADIASQSSPLKQAKYPAKPPELPSMRNRPRASSEPWLSSFISSQIEDFNASTGGADGFPFNPSRSRSRSDSIDEEEASGPSSSSDGDSSATLPQMLEKYSAIYNKNGRIGIYTRAERNDMISRFHEKRKRRVWKKKIRYHCRKNLADSRIRVKGRFVKCADDVARIEAAAAVGSVSSGGGSGSSSAAGDLLTCTESSKRVKVEGGLVTRSSLETQSVTSSDNTSTVKSEASTSSTTSETNGDDGGNMEMEEGEGGDEGSSDELREMLEGGEDENFARKRMRRHSIAY
mmetsp:Transcript_4379/g.8129  ORF Transcript_4379/g.8129 Transcript_4379/m.8129 type:complete len:346 (-) Transcript_4379:133-1170(-)